MSFLNSFIGSFLKSFLGPSAGKACSIFTRFMSLAGMLAGTLAGMLGSGFVFLTLALFRSRAARRRALAEREKSRLIQRRADEARANNRNTDIDPADRLRSKGAMRD